MNARAGSDSHASTAVHAAQCTTASGRHDVTAPEHGVAIGDVEVGVVAGRDLVAGRRRRGRRRRGRAGRPAPVTSRRPHRSADRRSLAGAAYWPRSPPSAAATTSSLARYHPIVAARPSPKSAYRGRQPELVAQLRAVDRVAQVVTGAVVDVVVGVGGPAEQRQDRLDDLPVVALAVGADQVRLPDPAAARGWPARPRCGRRRGSSRARCARRRTAWAGRRRARW